MELVKLEAHLSYQTASVCPLILNHEVRNNQMPTYELHVASFCSDLGAVPLALSSFALLPQSETAV